MADNHSDPRPHTATLNEYCQRNHFNLDYREVDVEGPPHNRIFTVVVVIDGREFRPATGKSKKEAKNNAARLAWEIIQQGAQEDPAPRPQQQLLPAPSAPSLLQLPESPQSSANLPEASSVDYTSNLNVYALKNKLTVEYRLVSRSGMAHMPIFNFVCMAGTKVGEGTGNTKAIAKNMAARQVYEQLNAQPTPRVEQSASFSDGSADTSLSSSQETSEASAKSIQDSSDVASSRSDRVMFLSSGIYSNGTDSDSECKKLGNESVEVVDQIAAMQLNENSSSSLTDSKGSATKPKRKDMQLAPTFSKLHQKESKYTVNKRFLEEFEEIVKIGSGGFGNVFKAKHSIDKRVCAVKRVQLIVGGEESKQEVQVLAILEHANIVRYYGCWIGKDFLSSEDSRSDNSLWQADQCECLFIFMEYCERGTLANWIEQKTDAENSEDDTSKKFQQILEGVAYIHSHNIIHRDLKPKNILITKDDKIKIGDFGLVTFGVNDLLVQRTEKRGTKSYMAPEQMGKTYGKEVDIFPLGLILFEMLYVFKTNMEKWELWQNIRECQLPKEFIKTFPRETCIIKKLLSKEPSERPTAIDLLNLYKDHLSRSHTC